jgi:hypothetical protein
MVAVWHGVSTSRSARPCQLAVPCCIIPHLFLTLHVARLRHTSACGTPALCCPTQPRIPPHSLCPPPCPPPHPYLLCASPPPAVGDEEDEDLDEMMILGATPNFGSTPSEWALQRSPAAGGLPSHMKMAAAALGSGTFNGNHFSAPGSMPSVPEMPGGVDDEEEEEEGDLMGMSPDLPSMMISPDINSPGFKQFIHQQMGTAGSAQGASS